MRRTRHVVLPVKSWHYMGLMVVSLACLTLGLVSRDRGGRSGSLAGPELEHTAPHGVDACPNLDHPTDRMSPYDESALKKAPHDNSIQARGLVSARSSGDSNPRLSRSLSFEPLRNSSSTLRRTKITTQNRRSIIGDRRNRKIESFRTRVDRNNGQIASMTSRMLEVREKSSSLSREKRSNDQRLIATQRRTRETNRYAEPSFDRTSGLRSLELRQQPISMIQQRRNKSPNRRLTLQTHDHRSIERREDRAVRNRRSDEIKSFERREDDTERRTRSNVVLRRSVRSVDSRDNRDDDDRSSRMSRSWENRVERKTEGRRSNERVEEQSPEYRQIRLNLVRKLATDISRKEIRGSGIRTEERRSSGERREMNQRERRDRLVGGSLNTRMDVRRSRSDDLQRAGVRRIGARSSERRSVERQDRDIEMEHRNRRVELSTSSRSNERRISRSDSRERRVNNLERSRVITQQSSSRRNIDRVDVDKMRVRSEDSNTAKRGEINGIQRQRIDVTARSSNVQQSRSSRADLLVRFERTEGRNDRSLVRRQYQERLGRKLAEIPQIRRSADRRETNRLERRKIPSALLARHENDRTSGTTYVTGERAWISSLRRDVRSTGNSKIRGYPVRNERFDIRDVSRERQTFSMNSPVRSSLSVSEIMDSQRRELFVTRDATQGRRKNLAEHEINRKVRTSRANDDVDTRREGSKITNEIRASRDSSSSSSSSRNDRERVNERSLMSFTNIPDFTNIGHISKIKNNEYLHQAIVLILCAVYGASLLKGKGGFYSFRNFITQANRFVMG